jgi:hypothetical protein
MVYNWRLYCRKKYDQSRRNIRDGVGPYGRIYWFLEILTLPDDLQMPQWKDKCSQITENTPVASCDRYNDAVSCLGTGDRNWWGSFANRFLLSGIFFLGESHYGILFSCKLWNTRAERHPLTLRAIPESWRYFQKENFPVCRHSRPYQGRSDICVRRWIDPGIQARKSFIYSLQWLGNLSQIAGPSNPDCTAQGEATADRHLETASAWNGSRKSFHEINPGREMSMHWVTGYKISQNPVGHIQISVHYDYIGQIIDSSIRIKSVILSITDKWDKTHEKWHMGSWKFGDLAVRDSTMQQRTMLWFRSRMQCALWQWQFASSTGLREVQSSSVPPQSVCHYIKWFRARISIFDIHSWFMM